jgi:predicted transcriptional regulator of viral defense system
MRWEEFLVKFAERPLFHSSMLKIFPDDPHHIQVQLSRWVDSGKLSQIRKEWYLIEKPFRLKEVPVPVIANTVVHPSYLSLEWALQYYEMIPEYVPNPTSITTNRGIRFTAQKTLFLYHHVQFSFFAGYTQTQHNNHTLYVASPEKALMDKIYIFVQGNEFSLDWLRELRLQNLDQFDFDRFRSYVKKTRKRGFAKAVKKSIEYLKGEQK